MNIVSFEDHKTEIERSEVLRWTMATWQWYRLNDTRAGLHVPLTLCLALRTLCRSIHSEWMLVFTVQRRPPFIAKRTVQVVHTFEVLDAARLVPFISVQRAVFILSLQCRESVEIPSGKITSNVRGQCVCSRSVDGGKCSVACMVKQLNSTKPHAYTRHLCM